MAANMARRNDYDAPAPVSRGTRRELARIEQQDAVQLARMEAQQQAELVSMIGSEQAALVQSRMRMRGSKQLREDAIDGIAGTLYSARTKSRGDALAEKLMVDEVIGFKGDADICAISYAARPLS